jgi:hypothetical protein
MVYTGPRGPRLLGWVRALVKVSADQPNTLVLFNSPTLALQADMSASGHLNGTTFKRKRPTTTSSARKKSRNQYYSIDELPWIASKAQQAYAMEEDGIIGLEEVDDVEVVYEDTEAGKVAKFKVRMTPPPNHFTLLQYRRRNRLSLQSNPRNAAPVMMKTKLRVHLAT